MASNFNFGSNFTPGLNFNAGSSKLGAAAPTTAQQQQQPAFQFNLGSSAVVPTTTVSSLFGNTPTATGSSPFALKPPSTAGTFTMPNLNLGGSQFSFGSPATTTTTSSLTTAPSLNFSLGGSTTAMGATVPAFNFSTPPVTAPTVPTGLGGIAQPSGTITTQKTTGADETVNLKAQTLPNELSATVDNFKRVLQEQKSISAEVSRSSIRDFIKIRDDLDAVNQLIDQFQRELFSNKYDVDQLKMQTARGLQSVEMAQRTQDTPASLQYENTAPLRYFLKLTDEFEQKLNMLKSKIQSIEKCLKLCNNNNSGSVMDSENSQTVSKVVTSQELTVTLKRLHDIFVALAGRMHSIHNQVEVQKEHYRKMRREQAHDTSDPFTKIGYSLSGHQRLDVVSSLMCRKPPDFVTGPTPFNTLAVDLNNFPVLQQQQQQQPSTPAATTVGGLFGAAPMMSNPIAPITSTSLFTPSSGTNLTFGLQKPFATVSPSTTAGVKRWKQ